MACETSVSICIQDEHKHAVDYLFFMQLNNRYRVLQWNALGVGPLMRSLNELSLCAIIEKLLQQLWKCWCLYMARAFRKSCNPADKFWWSPFAVKISSCSFIVFDIFFAQVLTCWSRPTCGRIRRFFSLRFTRGRYGEQCSQLASTGRRMLNSWLARQDLITFSGKERY